MTILLTGESYIIKNPYLHSVVVLIVIVIV